MLKSDPDLAPLVSIFENAKSDLRLFDFLGFRQDFLRTSLRMDDKKQSVDGMFADMQLFRQEFVRLSLKEMLCSPPNLASSVFDPLLLPSAFC